MIHTCVLMALMGLVAADVPFDSPKCDSSIDSTLKKTFPGPVPKDLLDEISKLGSWSVLTVTAPNLKQLKDQDKVCAQNIVSKDKKTVSGVRKMVPGAMSQQFSIEEKDDKFNLAGINDPKNSFTVQVLYVKDGVALISKCCKDCEYGTEILYTSKGDGLNLAVAVADNKKSNSATYAAVMEVREKLKSIKLDIPIGELSSCIDKEV